MPTAMRDSNRFSSRGRHRLLAPIVAIGLLATACGSAAPSPSAVATPVRTAAPVVTPDPHLSNPASLEDVYRELQRAGLDLVANTAGTGKAGKEPLRDIVATYAGWPLIISEYSSTKALAKAKKWKAGKKPGQGETPLAIKGLNILLEWGPTTGKRPPKPDADQRKAIAALIAALDPILYPLKVRSNVKVALPVHTPVPAASPSASTGSSTESTAP
jgi:hypothetical protein